MVARVRGTRDIIDPRLMFFAMKAITKQLQKYHFQQIVTPILEPVALFKRSLGLETDVVSKEMFIVGSSSAEENIDDQICLRPEATASVVRAFIEEGIQIIPWKVFLFGSMFRYERPQKGRYREFYQCSLELIGARSLAYDAQLLSMLDRLFRQSLKLEAYALHLNFLGCSEDRVIFKEQVSLFLEKHVSTLCSTCTTRKDTNVLRIFDCKNETCQELYTKAPVLADCFCEECAIEWRTLQDHLEELSVPFVVMPRLVRGLDYYNKTVFEFVSPVLGAQSTFCGGGRYDQLVKELGAREDQPSVGAAIGIDRLVLLLETVQHALDFSYEPKLFVIVPVSEEQHALALQVADALIRADLSVDVFFDGSVKNMMRKADKSGAQTVLLIGKDEQEAGTVKIKHMQSGQEEVVKQIEIARHLKNFC
jgi:histidyl-tRNA synthetase